MFGSTSLSMLVTTAIMLSIIVNTISIDDRSDYAYATTTTTTTTTTAATLPGFNFAAAGDWGCTDDTIDTVNNILDKNPELVLGLGDYSYDEDSTDCWFDIIQPINNIMKISIGNHEYERHGNEEYLRKYMEHFGLTSQYYSFDYQNVHFIALATESEYLDMSTVKAKEQLAFVKNDLEKTSANPNIKWIIPFFHQMMYYEDEESGRIMPHDENMRKVYHPLFEKYGVNLALQAHTHAYERTYPLRVNSDEDAENDPIVTNQDLTKYYNTDGLVIATVGTGGAIPTGLDGDPEYTPIQYQDLFGFLNVDVSSDGTTLIGTFYDNDGGGEIKDQFTITKSAEGDLFLPPSPDLPVEEETDYGLEGRNDDVVENADEPDNGSEGANDEATESEGGIADEEEAIASDE
jgi:Calcineurin-like phosphoesterase